MMVKYDWNGSTGTDKIPITGHDKVDGEDVVVTGAGTANSTVFSGWNSTVWDIPGGSLSITNISLPTLKDMPGGSQNPQLP